MSRPVKIQLLSSLCTRNEHYIERIKRIARKIGLECTLEWITDIERIHEMGIYVNCSGGYCPGCIMMHGDHVSEKCAPALFVNTKLAFYNYPPDDVVLEQYLTQYL